MDSVEKNKQIARQIFTFFEAGDVDGALTLLTDDATWWIAGDPAAIPASGARDKARIARVLRDLYGRMTDGISIEVVGMTAEDDRVAVQARSHGKLANGRVYANEYHFLFTFRDGAIREVREYLDTHHVYETFVRQ